MTVFFCFVSFGFFFGFVLFCLVRIGLVCFRLVLFVCLFVCLFVHFRSICDGCKPVKHLQKPPEVGFPRSRKPWESGAFAMIPPRK